VSTDLRAAHDALVADESLRGAAFGDALASLLDTALIAQAAALPAEPWAIVALGSYARRELCPGSDVDVMLLHGGGRRARAPEAAGALWYPLWDAAFVLGQSVRTVKEAIALADDDLDALTAFLDVRVVAGDAALVDDLVARARRLVPRRRDRVIEALADAARLRHERPGPVAEMLEPNLKDGAGGLRDLQAPGWAGWAVEPEAGSVPDGWAGGVATLLARGYLHERDPERLAAARTVLLDARVALQRVTKGKSDQLLLQDQDAVAALVGAADADALVRGLGEAARAVVWITTDLWSRLLDAARGPTSLSGAPRDLGAGVWLRDGRIALGVDTAVDTTTVLHAAACSAEHRAPFERATLARLGDLGEPHWERAALDAFLALLAGGRGAIPVFEALDHEGVLVPLLPEWEHVKARSQRNAYHRFTVDRHSLEAVAEAATLLDPGNPAGAGFDGDVARRAPRAVLLLGALLHDIAKGTPGDHSEAGAATARGIARRIGLDAESAEQLAWLVGYHLLLADTATRRDLSDELTVAKYARAVGDTARNELLYALTLADARATGPAAWNAGKAALVRELFVKADTLLSGGVLTGAGDEHRAGMVALCGQEAAAYLDAMPPGYAAAFPVEQLARQRLLVEAGELATEWDTADDGSLRVTVVAPDRTGLLARVAGTLALAGFDIGSASGFTHRDGVALEVFTGVDRFGRLAGAAGRDEVTGNLAAALRDELALDDLLRERSRRYRPRAAIHADRDVRVVVDPDASAFATVVEVHAPDDVGLLARVARVFDDLGVDVTQAIVQTTGDRVVDVFYVRRPDGGLHTDRHALDRLRATLVARLTTEVTLDR
jgi:[protein-PII] uridylyltransferase